jgi:hypothetical protein
VNDAQLIYVSTRPEVREWLQRAVTTKNEAQLAIAAFEERINDALGPIDGRPRQLRATLGLITGAEAASEFEATPDGWDYDTEFGSHMPNLATEAGARWQREIDALPALTLANAATEVGMPDVVSLQMDGQPVGELNPLFSAGVEGGVTFALWNMREIKPVVDQMIAEYGTGYWTEMPRSAWYARVEYFEAIAAAEAAAAGGGPTA